MARQWRLGLHLPPAVSPVEYAWVFFFLLKPGKIGIMCVTDKMLCFATRFCCLKSLWATANEKVFVHQEHNGFFSLSLSLTSRHINYKHPK